MSKTSPRVAFGLYAIEIKQDSTPSMPDLQPFSKALDLKTDNAGSRPYATFEPNFWLLDGGYKFLPTNTAAVHVGLMSLAMSDDMGEFATPPILTVEFSVDHNTDGLSLRFDSYTGDFANPINISYYDANNALLQSNTYIPIGTEFSTDQEVTGFRKIVITFFGTSRTYRYLRVLGIGYGQLITFSGTSIKGANVVEESDPLSAEIRINTFGLRLFSSDDSFSILNPEGYYAALMERQPLAVYEDIDNTSVFIGQYYLDTWKNNSDTEIEFSCVDIIGILDRIPYKGGIWTGAGIVLQDLIEDIMEAISIPYDLDLELYDIPVIGWIPAVSYREALQQIAFAVGASIDCSRSWSLKIYKSKIAADSEATAAITKAEKGTGSSLALKPLVTGVEVTGHNYVSSTDTKELYNGDLPAGTHEITFNQPMHDLSATGATITESGVNYAILEVAAPGTVVLSGQTYNDTMQIYSITTAGLSATIKPNILKVTDATLVNLGNLGTVTQRVYDYFQGRYLQKAKLYAPLIQIGDVALIDTLYDKKIRGVVEKLSIDLFGGMVAQADIVGVQNVD